MSVRASFDSSSCFKEGRDADCSSRQSCTGTSRQLQCHAG